MEEPVGHRTLDAATPVLSSHGSGTRGVTAPRGSAPSDAGDAWSFVLLAARGNRRLAPIETPAELHRSERGGRLQALIDSSPLALVEFDLDTRIRLWNPAAERIFGWSSEEMLGRGGLPMAPPRARGGGGPVRARARRRVDQRLRDRASAQGRIARRRLDRGRARARPVRSRLGNMVAYTDITERKAQAAEVHRLNDELHARLEELAASRARIVAAGDVERRRLERNLHDGAQQRLVALSFQLRLAVAKLDADPAAARALLGERRRGAAPALEELRELARGLHPALLTDRGLRAASRCSRPLAAPGRARRDPGRAAAGARRSRGLLPGRRGADERRQVRAGRPRSRPDHRRRRAVVVEVADDGVGGARPRGRIRPARTGRPRRGARRHARDRQRRRRRHGAAGRDPGARALSTDERRVGDGRSVRRAPRRRRCRRRGEPHARPRALAARPDRRDRGIRAAPRLLGCRPRRAARAAALLASRGLRRPQAPDADHDPDGVRSRLDHQAPDPGGGARAGRGRPARAVRPPRRPASGRSGRQARDHAQATARASRRPARVRRGRPRR